jgi:hypothetical protein
MLPRTVLLVLLLLCLTKLSASVQESSYDRDFIKEEEMQRTFDLAAAREAGTPYTPRSVLPFRRSHI